MSPHQNGKEDVICRTTVQVSLFGTLSTRGYDVPGSHARGYQSTTPYDDSTAEAAVKVTAADTLAHLHTIGEGTAKLFAEEPGLGGSRVAKEIRHTARMAGTWACLLNDECEPHQVHAKLFATIRPWCDHLTGGLLPTNLTLAHRSETC